MTGETYADHLRSPRGSGHTPARAHTGYAGSASCGNTLEFRVQVTGETVVDAGFAATGCQSLTTAASLAVELLVGASVLDAARVSGSEIAEELELTAATRHVAPLVEDALHIALGRACYEEACVPAAPERTLVAMSGGVDSTVVAWLAQGEGLETVGVTLELWRDQNNDAERSCCSAQAVRGARAQAHRLGLPHFTLDLRGEFAAGVVKPYLDAHKAGETPNPCVHCNGDVRLDAMLDLAERLGARDLATGHYARIHDDGHGPLLAAAADPDKDQTYMLARLASARLERLRLPLGEYTKPQVRALAQRAGLSSADKPDSQDLCFLAGTDRRSFLSRHGAIADRLGEIRHVDGRVLGQHQGQHLYTVGQRKGIGISDPSGPLYVTALDARTNQVTVGPRSALEAVTVALRGVRLHRPSSRVTHVRLRYHSQSVACRLEDDLPAGNHSRLAVTLHNPSDSVVPGQSAQLLDGELVVGQATVGAR